MVSLTSDLHFRKSWSALEMLEQITSTEFS